MPTDILQSPQVLAVLLVSLRLGALILLAPPLAQLPIPATARMALVLALSAGLVAALAVQPADALISQSDSTTGWPTPVALIVAALGELTRGLALAIGWAVAFAAFDGAGRLLDLQVGFNLGAAFDPLTRRPTSVLGQALHLFGVALAFGLGAHHMLLRLLAHSLDIAPPGTPLDSAGWAAAAGNLGALAGQAAALGLALVIPVSAGLLLIDVALGWLSRTVPQLNLITVGIPIKAMAAVALLALTLPLMAPLANALAGAALTASQAWLH